MPQAGRKREGAQESAARMLATGMSVKQIAQALDMAENTIYHWKLRPDFRAMVSDIKQEIHERTMNAMVNLQVSAFMRVQEKLTEQLSMDNLSHRDQLAAARLSFDVANRAIEQSQLLEQIESLRRQIEELKNGSSDDGSEDPEAGTSAGGE